MVKKTMYLVETADLFQVEDYSNDHRALEDYTAGEVYIHRYEVEDYDEIWSSKQPHIFSP